ncbi:MAG: bifunctional DNA-binding transcriptional regulator/O6-methylguanine-DNA methyltransferase Ada [Vicinamibacteria bacterium]|nr:bifunctional DNA-binding transcriptional regulator/O6-methylguanine-DNA methyltransferase Ada [Vicinamibacteria bacterium]
MLLAPPLVSLDVTPRRLTPLDEAACWQAVVDRDRAADGRFVFAVRTTGVYCRPSCPARRPRRENVRFFAAGQAASAAGFRACRRCRPDGPDPRDESQQAQAARIRALCAWIAAQADGGEALTIADLARRAGLSEGHLQRSFRRVTGVSPRQYVAARRLERLKRELRDGRAVTAAIYEAGFGSGSRVYERAAERLGMTPGAYRRGGRGVEVAFVTIATPLGELGLGATERGICFLQFGASARALEAQLRAELPAAQVRPAAAGGTLRAWADALRDALGQDGAPLPELPLDLRGTAFEQRVWNALRAIPAGATRSYGEVATAMGEPRAARAVARACAANRTALLVPCHRVIRGDGGLGGFRWGLARKRRLVAREKA